MKFILKVKIPMETGNKRLKDPQFGMKMQQLLAEIKAEAAYFTTIEGCRGAFIVVNMDDASQMPAIAEPLFMWLNAEVCVYTVMKPEDLGKAHDAIAAAVEHWG